jgi:hypothetical protein
MFPKVTEESFSRIRSFGAFGTCASMLGCRYEFYVLFLWDLIRYVVQAYLTDPGPNSKFPIEGLLEAAEELIDELMMHPLDKTNLEPSFIHSFRIYPHANALA